MATYTDAKLSNFPDKIDDLPRLSDVSVNTIGKMNQYNSLMTSGNFTGANEILDDELAQCLFTADTYNKLRDAIIAVERSFKDDVSEIIGVAGDINDSTTDSATKKVTTYSSYKIDNLFNGITIEELGGLQVIDAQSSSYDMDTIIRNASTAIYLTNKNTLNTPFAQYNAGDTTIGNYTRAAILNHSNGSGYGIQIAYRQGAMPTYRTLINGTLSKWNFGYVRLSGDSTVSGTITATGFKGKLTGNVTGNADTATKLKTARTIQVNLSSTKTGSFDGTTNITTGVKGVLPEEYGGTGQTSIDTTPTSGSKSMVTSGGIYTALDKKLNKAGGEKNPITDKLWIKKSSYPGIIMHDTAKKSLTYIENAGQRVHFACVNEYTDNGVGKTRRVLTLRSSSDTSPDIKDSIILQDITENSNGEAVNKYYTIYGSHNTHKHKGADISDPQNTANTLINALEAATGTPKDGDYFISQYVGGNDSTTTTADKSNYCRRPMSKLWEYIKSKANSVYLKLSGGTLTGALKTSNHIYKSVDTSYLLCAGGTTYDNGGSLALYGKDHSTYPGAFSIRAKDASTKASLIGKPNGSLTWQDKELYGRHNITSGTTELTAGTSKLATGNIYLQYE